MDAVRLIRSTRHALKETGGEHELLAEAWQAQALAEAIVSRLAPHLAGPPALAPGGARAAPGRNLLTEVRQPLVALRELRDLLSELGVLLVSAACSVDDEAVYWQSMEALDAAADARDRVCILLRETEAAGEGADAVH